MMSLRAQQVLKEPEQVLSVSRGASLLLTNPFSLERIALGDPTIAEANAVSPTELLITGKTLGTTSLLIWSATGTPKFYSVQVTADAPGLERFIKGLMPDEDVRVSASGNTVTLSGTVRDPNSVARAVEIAETSGATVIDNLVAPPAVQILLQVRFAEITRSGMKDFATALSTLNPHELSDDGDWEAESISDGLLRLLLSNPNANIEGVIRASTSKGNFRSLAEPNLLTLPGKEAYFLAGGEFPYPTVQSQESNNVTIQFKEFGIKLRFTPNITRSGAIRLKVEPEVSSLDFANGLVIGGFQIPTLITRRAVTEVELRAGQYLAIAGLIDNNLIDNVTKIPILGDIPILGQFFRTTDARQRRSELLVLITPHFVVANDTAVPLPTGDPETWKLPRWLRYPKN
jgi:pilus assembly protein CpaC